MISDIRRLVDSYAGWVRDKSALRELDGGFVEITTPYLDRHNDYLQIYAQRGNEGGFRLTDGGEVLSALRSEGCDMKSPRRQALVKSLVQGFGVQRSGDELFVLATDQDFPSRKHSLVQAMLSVSDMFVLASPIVSSVFFDDVQHWLTSVGVRFVSRVSFKGRSGLDNMFDFAVPPSATQPERLVRAVGHPKLDTAKMLAFSWFDTRELRSPGAQFYAILNDQDHATLAPVTSALKKYDIVPVPWSGRQEVADILSR